MSYIRGMAEPNDPHDKLPADPSPESQPMASASDDTGHDDTGHDVTGPDDPTPGVASTSDAADAGPAAADPSAPADIAFPPPEQTSSVEPPVTLVGTVPQWSPPPTTPVPPTMTGSLSPATAEWLASRPADSGGASPADAPADPLLADATFAGDASAEDSAADDAPVVAADDAPVAEPSSPDEPQPNEPQPDEQSAEPDDTAASAAVEPVHGVVPAPAFDAPAFMVPPPEAGSDATTDEQTTAFSATEIEAVADDNTAVEGNPAVEDNAASDVAEPPATPPTDDEPFAIAPPRGTSTHDTLPPTLAIEPAPAGGEIAETIAIDLPPGDGPIPLADAPVEPAAASPAPQAEHEPAASDSAEQATPDADEAAPIAAPVGAGDLPLAAVAVAGGAAAAAHASALPPALPTDAEVFAHAHDDVEHRTGFLSRGPITKLAAFVGLVAVAAGLGVMLLACAGLTPINSGLMLWLNPWLYGFAIAAGVIAVCQLTYAILTKGRFGSAIVSTVVALAIVGLALANRYGGSHVNGMNPLFISQYIAMAGGGGAVLALLGGLLEHRRMREETHVLAALFVNVAAGLGGLLLWALYTGTKLM